jgi:hypothetical protein
MTHERTQRPAAPETARAARSPAPPTGRASVTALQRAVGNRATGRLLARWVRHPDPEQKKVMVPDSVAEAFVRDNPPQNT